MSAPPRLPTDKATTNPYTHAYIVDGEESLTDLEREILDEYIKLKENLDKLIPLLAGLASDPTAGILDGLRILERKTSLVSTLLKASVYSIVLQQEMLEGGDAGTREGGSFGGLG